MKKIITGMLLTCSLSFHMQAMDYNDLFRNPEVTSETFGAAAFVSLYNNVVEAPLRNQLIIAENAKMAAIAATEAAAKAAIIAKEIAAKVAIAAAEATANAAIVAKEIAEESALNFQNLLLQSNERLAALIAKQSPPLSSLIHKFTNPLCQFAAKNPYTTIAGIALTGLIVKCSFDITSQTLYNGYKWIKNNTHRTIKENVPLATGLALGGLALFAIKSAQ